MDGSTAFGSALAWIEGALLGSLAFSIAVIAVAGVGLMLLAGRIDFRRGARVILGCFILFGASAIANGILSIASGPPGSAELASELPKPTFPSVPPPAAPPASAAPYDPYAGAAVPTR